MYAVRPRGRYRRLLPRATRLPLPLLLERLRFALACSEMGSDDQERASAWVTRLAPPSRRIDADGRQTTAIDVGDLPIRKATVTFGCPLRRSLF